jgi:ATP-binding cassette, subfamily B, bacterial PglK
MKKTPVNKTPVNKTSSMLLINLWSHLNQKRKAQFGLLICLMIVSAFAEIVSLGAILPFLAVLIAPESVFNYSIAKFLAPVLGIASADQLVLPLTVAFASAAILAGLIRVLLLWVSTKVAFETGADLGVEIYRRTLYQPLQVHVAQNSSAVISGITIKVGSAVGVLDQMLKLFSSIILLVAIMTALLFIDPIVATLAAIGFGASYGLTSLITRRRLRWNGTRIAYEQTQVVKNLQEGLGGIRDVLLDGSQPVYIKIFSNAVYALRRAQGSNIVIAGTPRFIMESLGMVLIATLAYVLSSQPGGVATALPVLGALALGAQRLLPALQVIFNAWAGIAGSHAALADTVDLLNQPLPSQILAGAPESLLLEGAVRFDAVRYRYTDDGPWVLDGLNLVLPKGAMIGFVGSTGSGKSTVLDLFMGLLVPTEGEVQIDGQPINNTLSRAWQRSIAHVPQTIYLADTSLAENIAFGVPGDKIDMIRVRQAARQAQIADFIESRPSGYSAYVGELGVQLSGGQRQRIGIARALYKKASVLVFDEATSALDNTTEQSVMDAIEGLNPELTILLIAHRLSTVKRCNIIVELEHGRVVAQGTYDQLLECSPSFRRMDKLI